MRLCFTCLIILSLSILSLAFPPADEYQHGAAVVNFTDKMNVSNIQVSDGIVQFGVPELDQIAKEMRIESIEKIFPHLSKPDNPALVDLSRWHRIHFPDEVTVEEVVHAFEGKPFIETIEPDPIRKYDYVPSDPMVNTQWHVEHIGLYQAWDINKGNHTVEVGIIDSGYDTSHADLRESKWINYGEDANGDSIIDLWDWNYYDDDNNNKIDDFWGWDFIDGDNIAHDAAGDGHGSHTSGIAQADTDNETGVAGAGFDCRVMHLRCGYGGYVQVGYSGIQYAAEMSADVISCSWGSTSPSGIEQQAINSAHQAGCVITCSAGNEGYTNAYAHYPSGYQNVIAVGATTQNDTKVDFSNYNMSPGDTQCDIMAPGVDILSTWMGGGYLSTQGTSMSTPLVAGVCMLIRSVDPTLTPAEVETVLVNSAFDINALNPTYYNLLGHGRVDALAALKMISPYITLETVGVADNGNGDGRPDPGETCQLTISIFNDPEAQPANFVLGTISSDDEAVTINTSFASFGTIIPGYSMTNQTTLDFTVGPTVPHYAEFNLALTAQNFNTDLQFIIELGRPGILVVDDDGGGAYQSFYEISFENLDLFIDVWEQENEPISLNELQKYGVVVWETGSALSTLDTDEQNTISAYLDDGGNMLLSSTNAGADIGSSAFYSNYLHASFVQDTVPGVYALTGVAGHPFADSTNLFLIGGTGAGNIQSMDAIEPGANAQAAYTYNTTAFTGCITYDGAYKLAYFSFPVESVTGLNFTITRHVLIENILNWFGFVSVPSANTVIVPSDYILNQNYPNPFNPKTQIEFALPHKSRISLSVFNSTGRMVGVLTSGMFEAGFHQVEFDGSDLSSGLYFVNLRSGDVSITNKMLLIK